MATGPGNEGKARNGRYRVPSLRKRQRQGKLAVEFLFLLFLLFLQELLPRFLIFVVFPQFSSSGKKMVRTFLLNCLFVNISRLSRPTPFLRKKKVKISHVKAFNRGINKFLALSTQMNPFFSYLFLSDASRWGFPWIWVLYFPEEDEKEINRCCMIAGQTRGFGKRAFAVF